MSFPTVEEIRQSETMSRNHAIEVYEDSLAFNETLFEFAKSDEERKALSATIHELRSSLKTLCDDPESARYAVQHRTLVVAFGHSPHRIE